MLGIKVKGLKAACKSSCLTCVGASNLSASKLTSGDLAK